MVSPTPYPLALNNSDQDIEIFGDPTGIHNMVLAFDVLPSSGTVVVQYRVPWSTAFTTLQHANSADITAGPISMRIDGPVAVIRVTFSGLVGGVGARLWIATGQFPISLYNGQAAITTQPYTEANVKNGVQFYARAAWPLADPILAGTTRKLYFQTGSKQVLVKVRNFDDVSEELVLRIFGSPTGVSGGTDLVIHNYNGVNPVPTSILQAKKNVTTVSDGTELDGSDPEYFFGANAAGGRGKTSTPIGIERVIGKNSEIVVTITNTGTGSARAQFSLTWYEGGTDMPL